MMKALLLLLLFLILATFSATGYAQIADADSAQVATEVILPNAFISIPNRIGMSWYKVLEEVPAEGHYKFERMAGGDAENPNWYYMTFTSDDSGVTYIFENERVLMVLLYPDQNPALAYARYLGAAGRRIEGESAWILNDVKVSLELELGKGATYGFIRAKVVYGSKPLVKPIQRKPTTSKKK